MPNKNKIEELIFLFNTTVQYNILIEFTKKKS